MAYFSGQGRVYIGERDEFGNPKGLLPVGNVPDLKVSLSIETLEHKESQTGQRLTDLTLIKEKKGEFSCTLEELLTTNLELALYGTTTNDTTGGTVTDEALPNPVNVGELYVLQHQNISGLSIKDSAATPVTVDTNHYRVNEKHGSIVFNDLATYTQPFKASYSYGASRSTAMFTRPLPERWVRFEGLNTADGNRPVVIDLYRVSINPAKELSVITDELLQFELSGNVLADLTKANDNTLGQFGRIVLV